MPCEYLTVDVSDLTGIVRHNISKDILKWRLNARQAVLGDSMAVAVKEAKAEDTSRHENHDVFFDDVFVPDEYVVGQLDHGFQYISQALDLERFTMFTFSPIKQRLDLLIDHVRSARRDGQPLKDDPKVRSRIARLATTAEVARGMGLRVVDASVKAEASGGAPPTIQSSEYKLFTTEFSKTLADASAKPSPDA